MPKTTTDLQSLARLGGGISIDATSKTTTDLQSLARLINALVGTLILRNTDLEY